jgi:hypothetical protein
VNNAPGPGDDRGDHVKTSILILVLTMAGCAVESPRERTVESNLCTVDDSNCGAPGSNPNAVHLATLHDYTQTTYGHDDSEDGAVCEVIGGSWQCSVQFHVGGTLHYVECNFYGDGTWQCNGV